MVFLNVYDIDRYVSAGNIYFLRIKECFINGKVVCCVWSILKFFTGNNRRCNTSAQTVINLIVDIRIRNGISAFINIVYRQGVCIRYIGTIYPDIMSRHFSYGFIIVCAPVPLELIADLWVSQFITDHRCATGNVGLRILIDIRECSVILALVICVCIVINICEFVHHLSVLIVCNEIHMILLGISFCGNNDFALYGFCINYKFAVFDIVLVILIGFKFCAARSNRCKLRIDITRLRLEWSREIVTVINFIFVRIWVGSVEFHMGKVCRNLAVDFHTRVKRCVSFINKIINRSLGCCVNRLYTECVCKALILSCGITAVREIIFLDFFYIIIFKA